MKLFNLLTTGLLSVLTLGILHAREPDAASSRKSVLKQLAESCAPATAQADLNINNVRARILNGGDMWWDLNTAQYEVPKGSNKHSMFAGALWLGGIDEAEQLKLAAMTYRGRGVDYWPGPLDDGANIAEQTCQEYDRHWVVLRSEVETHAAFIACKETPGCDVAENFPGYEGNFPESITQWPGNGIGGQLATKLAPFNESDTNGIPGLYEPEWDYPGYDLTRQADCQAKENDFLYGDQTIWWVYNDKGNIHTETGAASLGFEIRAQAFAFTSNDEINNMTFNNYRILNKSSFRLTNTYFGTWFDPDIGNPRDDIIGSDIARGLGYCYNGDGDDDGALGYGLNPPAIGFDFFQGPFADYFDGIDNDRDGCPDGILVDGNCLPEDPSIGRNERIIMSGFMYYNNGTSAGNPEATSDPDNAEQFYNYLRSFWKDGRPLVVENPSGRGQTGNGDGYVQNTAGFVETKFAYPGVSFDTTGAFQPDQPIENGGWYESPNNLADKRGLHTAGPFSLAPGALNFITTGTVWARNFTGSDLFASVNDVIVADDKAQNLFDNCFQVLDGPNAPRLNIVELDQELIINFQNAFTPAIIGYEQIDPLIPPIVELTKSETIDSTGNPNYFKYVFEGFQVFQVANRDVSVDNLYDPAQSRLIFQSDLKNDVAQLVNYAESPDLLGNPLTPMDMTLEANNNGIQLSYRVTEDAFAEGDRQLVNNKEYYFYVISYAQNNYIPFLPSQASDDVNAQKEPFLAGRRGIGNNSKAYVAIPNQVPNLKGGTRLNSQWGDLADITRLAGAGNGSAFLRVAQSTRDAIVTNFFSNEIQYTRGNAPIEIKVIDPFKVRNGNYQVVLKGVDDTAKWELIREGEPEGIESFGDLTYEGENIFIDYGISVSLSNPVEPGSNREGSINNGVIGGALTFADPGLAWLTGLPDSDSENPTNWILAGTNDVADDNLPTAYYNDHTANIQDGNVDAQGNFETILGGTWAPLALASDVPPLGTPVAEPVGDRSPGFPIRPAITFNNLFDISGLPNIDVVITSDWTQWSRVPVLEMGNIQSANEGQAELFNLREDFSLKLENGQLVVDTTSKGWSYFPGYAYNVETGNRLNLVMGENSWLKSENGDDMLFNPTANFTQKLGNIAFGGLHTVYVLADSASYRSRNRVVVDLTYKGDAIDDYPIKAELENLTGVRASDVFGSMTWCTIGMLTSNDFAYKTYDEIPTDVRIELRVQSPFEKANPMVNEGNPLYEFSLEGLAPDTSNLSIAKSALDDIRVVPNPYYGSSAYEDGQLDNIVKITNLPDRCEINIFQTNGTLVRNIVKDSKQPAIEWDLKNDFNVPIASGIYIIHIDAGEAGQKVVKWMGTLRPVDLNAF
jgi:hypothetical protein